MQQTENQSSLPWQERSWNIGTATNVRSGKRAVGLIEHGTYADGTPLQSPVHVLVGAQEGPVLYVQAAVHGNEVNGVEVLRRVASSLDPELMRGVLIVVPVANGPALLMRQRHNPFDKEDMNRVWPGKLGGMASQQMAYSLYQQAIHQAQYVVDLHTANSNTLLHVVYGRGDEASRKLAEVFGLEVLLEENVDDDLKQSRFLGKLRNTLTAQGVPAITPELGGSDHFEEDHIVLGVRGVLNVMKHLGMLQGAIEPPDRPQITLYGSHLDRVRASLGGIWVAQVKGGDQVKQGQLLGHVYAIRTFETVEQIFAPYDGYILGTSDLPIVNTGDNLVNLCRLDDN
ncbi:MAG: succinylglutamate desuccinylase/aspartoacylase family protein [Ktedonobacteraceae bacterium]|nr:succinylglutamate desuccinylase/aspartoacylase family protein [Ktedonobacteraceae bacterium]